jgi:hypothetical protein
MLKNNIYKISYQAFNRREEPIESGVRDQVAFSREYAIEQVKSTVRNWSRSVARIEVRILSINNIQQAN